MWLFSAIFLTATCMKGLKRRYRVHLSPINHLFILLNACFDSCKYSNLLYAACGYLFFVIFSPFPSSLFFLHTSISSLDNLLVSLRLIHSWHILHVEAVATVFNCNNLIDKSMPQTIEFLNILWISYNPITSSNLWYYQYWVDMRSFAGLRGWTGQTNLQPSEGSPTRIPQSTKLEAGGGGAGNSDSRLSGQMILDIILMRTWLFKLWTWCFQVKDTIKHTETQEHNRAWRISTLG